MTKSVLIVDDEPMARTLLRLTLVRAGFHVSEAEDGFDALDKVRKSLPDIVLLDEMMPGLNGFSVCEILRRDFDKLTLPIIMLSARTDLESVNKGLAVGVNTYLTKPISREELMQHVMAVLADNVT